MNAASPPASGGENVAPTQVVAAFGGVATTNPAPIVDVRLSVRLMPVRSEAVAARVSVTVSRDFVPACTVVGLKTFATVSARATATVPVIVDVLLARLVTTPPTAIVLV